MSADTAPEVAEMKSIDDRDLKADQLTQFNVLDASPTWRSTRER